ncbi:DNA-binding domain-containing protein [Nitrincola sp. MINF-07-Sa-05]|uniref:HvfC/BufC N-terminal domain-containing protein n=1 Tax=Nitrincola salilacus TaxID=3400273 RepID=UPI003918617F
MSIGMSIGMNDQTDFARALLDPALPCPDDLQTWNHSDPTPRFAVYRNNIVVSLVDALAVTFPVCCELVGETFFRSMARVFVSAHPPRSRILTFYGREFPAFIETFTPAASVPYLADVARLEMLRLEAFHAADVEPLSADEIARVLSDPAQLPGLCIEAHPSAAVLQSRFAVFSLWAAHQEEGDPELASVDPQQPQTLLVVRAGLDVQCIHVAPATGIFIERLIQGAALAQAQEQAQEQALAQVLQDAQTSEPEFDLVSALTLLLRWQIITNLRPGDHHEQLL